MTENVLEVNNLCLQLKQDKDVKEILSGISFSLKKGGSLGVVGQSGSGKSMTAKAVCGLLPEKTAIISGSIVLKGEHNIVTMPSKIKQQFCSRNIALIMQDSINALNPYIKIDKQLKETFKFHNSGADKTLIRQMIEKGMNNAGLNVDKTILSSYPHQLSGGMRQRIAIVMALASKAEIIIADEPTTSLDSVHQKRLVDLLKDLCEKHKLSLIFITHNLAIVSQLCTDVAVLKEGKVIESGRVDDVFSAPVNEYTAELICYTERLLR